MARKGSTKVRTGCFTCKIRKVKCDETKPFCTRCTSTERKCDGYPVAPIGQAAYSWDELLAVRKPSGAVPLHGSTPLPRRMPPSLRSMDQLEARALEFFRLQVSPVLSIHSSASFWRTLVLQVSQQEPAVRHALACIGSVYEGLDEEASTVGPLERSREAFTLKQYNLALQHVSRPNVDKNLVLVVCLLFICIESMRENRAMAIEHCRHGVIISNEATAAAGGGGGGQLDDWARELRPIFLRVATLPYFFGEEADFPQPTAFTPSAALDVASLEAANADTLGMAWDAMLNRSVRLVRMGLINRRESERSQPVPQHLLDEQRAVTELVTPWERYLKDQRRKQSSPSQDPETFTRNVHFEIQSIIAKVWTACCLQNNEMMYDEFMPDFERILSLTEQIITLQLTMGTKTTKTTTTTTTTSSSTSGNYAYAAPPGAGGPRGARPKFIFEMGFMPFLYWVILSCRRLDLRLIALRHALLLACEREHLFNTRTLFAVGVRVVELEHGITLDPTRPECEGALTAPLPADEVRVRSADITQDVETRVDAQGQTAEYRKVWFLVQPGAIIPGFVDWIKVGPHATRGTSLPAMSRWSPRSRQKFSGQLPPSSSSSSSSSSSAAAASSFSRAIPHRDGVA